MLSSDSQLSRYASHLVMSRVIHPSDSNPPIHILDNDSLLNIFYLYRPAILVDVDTGVRAGDSSPPRWGEWTHERWWHKLSHVCQRWRRLIFASAPYLGLCLVCTYGTSVARMLECFPPFPIVLDYPYETRSWTVEDEDGILLALQHRARLHRIRLCVPPDHEEKLVMAIEMEFPMLEYLYIGISNFVMVDPGLEISHTFQAPRLRHLALTRCPFLVASPSLTTSAGLVTLSLMSFPDHCCYHPYDLFRRLSVLSQLVVLRIAVFDDRLTHELEEQQLDIPSTHLTLPNLRLFEFAGHNKCLKTLLPWMTTPLLEKLQIIVLPYLIIPAPTLIPYSSCNLSAKQMSLASAVPSSCSVGPGPLRGFFPERGPGCMTSTCALSPGRSLFKYPKWLKFLKISARHSLRRLISQLTTVAITSCMKGPSPCSGAICLGLLIT